MGGGGDEGGCSWPSICGCKEGFQERKGRTPTSYRGRCVDCFQPTLLPGTGGQRQRNLNSLQHTVTTSFYDCFVYVSRSSLHLDVESCTAKEWSAVAANLS